MGDKLELWPGEIALCRGTTDTEEGTRPVWVVLGRLCNLEGSSIQRVCSRNGTPGNSRNRNTDENLWF